MIEFVNYIIACLCVFIGTEGIPLWFSPGNPCMFFAYVKIKNFESPAI